MKNKSTILFVALIYFFVIHKSGFAQRNLFEGNAYYENKEYEKAIPFYKKYIDSESSTEVLEKLAYCHRQLEQYEEAIKYYELSTQNKDHSLLSLLYYAESLQKSGLYLDAVQKYQMVVKRNKSLYKQLELKINSCKQAHFWSQNSDSIIIENVKDLNSKHQEIGLFICNDRLYFSSSRLLEKSYDEVAGKSVLVNHFRIYQSKISNNPVNFYDITLCNFSKWPKDVDIAHPTFNETLDKFFFSFSNSYTPGNTKFYQHDKSTYTEMKILYSRKVDRKWSPAVNINTIEALNFAMIHPCLNKNGDKLYFASDKTGGKGNFDLYYCTIDKQGKMSTPINLGPKINTKGLELYPSYADDTVLYFSSDGHIGMGDLDIYKASLKNGEVISVENLKHPINSPRNDFSFVPLKDKKSGYFCSNRPGGMGEDDIYYFKFQNPNF